jgi:hypothetical protein
MPSPPRTRSGLKALGKLKLMKLAQVDDWNAYTVEQLVDKILRTRARSKSPKRKPASPKRKPASPQRRPKQSKEDKATNARVLAKFETALVQQLLMARGAGSNLNAEANALLRKYGF